MENSTSEHQTAKLSLRAASMIEMQLRIEFFIMYDYLFSYVIRWILLLLSAF